MHHQLRRGPDIPDDGGPIARQPVERVRRNEQLDGGLVSFLSQRTYTVAKNDPQANSLIPGNNICGAPSLTVTSVG